MPASVVGGSELVDILAQQRKRRLDQNFDIQPERPIVDVGDIVLYALFHLVEGFGFAAVAADLCQAGDAGFDSVAGHVGGDLAGVVVVVGYGMWSRANEGHAALQYVE